MTKRLPKSFYQGSALTLAPKLLGKYLVHKTHKGIISGMITDVEAYPAHIDEVSHGNKRTKRTEVMYHEGGHAYVYKIYGMHYQFAVVVNRKDIPEVVFIRAVKPEEGIEFMRKNFCKNVDLRILTKSPGNVCKSFGITTHHYGVDLTDSTLWLEDRGVVVRKKDIIAARRVGINAKIKGSGKKLRFYLRTLKQ
ncbi:MAG: DNA-3-methyladenine glycosylase [Patescibacteria group bacterium]